MPRGRGLAGPLRSRLSGCPLPGRGGRLMDYRLLGPLEVRDGGRVCSLGSRKQRALLAILLLNAREVVSSDRLIEELWGGQAPATALGTLRAHVSRLRRAVGAEGGGGYQGGGFLPPVGAGGRGVGRF